MSLLTKDLLINFLFILLPLFLVHIFYLSKYVNRFGELKDWMITVLPIASIILCMLFPFVANEHFIFDLRRIPFILVALYGGYKLGLFSLFLVLIVRYFVGVDGFHVTLLSFLFLAALVLPLSKYYLKMSLKQRLIVSVFSMFVAVLILMFFSKQVFGINIETSVWIEYIVINMVGMLIATALWEAIRKNYEILQRISKMEKLEIASHLAASISHEVRNPLTTSRGFMQMLYQDLSVQKKEEYLNIAIQELDRATEIINDYLMFAKPAPEKIEELSILKEIEHVVKVITPLANINNVQISILLLDGDGKSCFILGERKRFQQCLINILKNGVESMPSGGEIKVQISYNHPNVQIDIQDKGRGMTQEQIIRLGEPYFTTKETGTGLGMMVSFSIISGMNGTISVESEKGKGTSFSIKLPISKQSDKKETTLKRFRYESNSLET